MNWNWLLELIYHKYLSEMTIKKYLVLMLLQNNQALHKKEIDTNINSYYPSGNRDWRS